MTLVFSTVDFNKRLEKAITSSHIASDDKEVVSKLYTSLSFSKAFWDDVLFHDIHWLDAFNLLNSIECQVLSAYNNAVSCMASRVTWCGNFGITRMLPLIYEDQDSRSDENVLLSVFLGGINEHSRPEFTVNGAEVLKVEKGIAVMKVDFENKNKKVIYGTITVKNNSGIPKTFEWNRTLYAKP